MLRGWAFYLHPADKHMIFSFLDVLDAAREIEGRLPWLRGGRELIPTLSHAGRLLDHGVRVVERLVDLVDEPEDHGVARGWLDRVARFRDVNVADPNTDADG
jgi:hypothetical protein